MRRPLLDLSRRILRVVFTVDVFFLHFHHLFINLFFFVPFIEHSFDT